MWQRIAEGVVGLENDFFNKQKDEQGTRTIVHT